MGELLFVTSYIVMMFMRVSMGIMVVVVAVTMTVAVMMMAVRSENTGADYVG